MATDLSKFLFFSAGQAGDLDIYMVASFKAIESFVEELQKSKVGPSGIISKINVIVTAMSFVLHQ